jgi:hypothetical protein
LRPKGKHRSNLFLSPHTHSGATTDDAGSGGNHEHHTHTQAADAEKHARKSRLRKGSAGPKKASKSRAYSAN